MDIYIFNIIIDKFNYELKLNLIMYSKLRTKFLLYYFII